MSSGTPPNEIAAQLRRHRCGHTGMTEPIHWAADEIERLEAFSDKLQELCYVLGEGWPIDGGGSELRHTHLAAAQIRPFLQQALIDACVDAEAEYPEVAS